MGLQDERLKYIFLADTKQLTAGVSKVKSALGGIGNMITGIGTLFLGSAIFNMGKHLADVAGSAEKAQLRFKRVFKNLTGEVQEFATSLSEGLGRTQTEIRSGLVSFQAFFQGLGFGSKEASQMSMKMQALSLDLASFFDMADSNAQKRFLAALAGSPEVLDQFGINLKQAAIQQELYRMGIKSTVQNTSEMIKTQARLSIIMRAMTDNGIVGDAERTMDTYGGTLKRTNASITNMSVAIGTVLLPSFKNFLNTVTEVTTAVAELFSSFDKSTDKYEEEKNTITDLVNLITSLNKASSVRRDLLNELNTKYPRFLGDLDADKVGNEELLNRLQAVNKEYDKRIAVASIEDQVKETKTYIKNLKERIETEGLLIKKMERQGEEFERVSGTGATQIGKVSAKKEELVKLQIELANGEYLLDELLKSQSDELRTQSALYSHLFNEQEGRGRIEDEILDNTDKEKKNVFDTLGHIKFLSSLRSKDADQLYEIVRDLQVQVALTDQLFDETNEVSQAWVLIEKNLKAAQRALNDYLNTNAQGFAGKIEGSNFFSTPSDAPDVKDIADNALQVIDILRPIADAATELWKQILTPPDTTVSKQEQKEKTRAAFAGVMIGLGEALFSLGMGSLLAYKGLGSLGTNPAVALSMMAAGSALIYKGKGQLQKVRNSASARSTGGNANSGSGGSGRSFDDFMKAIQGEQVFRLAGNDLVTVMNRSNNFQKTLGG